MSSGNIVQIIGAVVDVEFPRGSVPKIYDALRLDENGLILEVHPDPAKAVSDGAQSLTPKRFKELMNELELVARAVGRNLH